MNFSAILKLILSLLKIIMQLPADQQPAAVDALIRGVEELRSFEMKDDA